VHEFSSCLMLRPIKSMSILTRVKMTTPSVKLGEKDFWVLWKAAPRPVPIHCSEKFSTVVEGLELGGWTSDLWLYSFLNIDRPSLSVILYHSGLLMFEE
jgi:hypothetical protein